MIEFSVSDALMREYTDGDDDSGWEEHLPIPCLSNDSNAKVIASCGGMTADLSILGYTSEYSAMNI